jgi:hypothetical protein
VVAAIDDEVTGFFDGIGVKTLYGHAVRSDDPTLPPSQPA